MSTTTERSISDEQVRAYHDQQPGCEPDDPTKFRDESWAMHFDGDRRTIRNAIALVEAAGFRVIEPESGA